MDWIRSVEWPVWFGYAAVLSSIITCAMKTMIPLRVVSMICNSLFIIYGIFAHIYPTLILNCILLPLNGLRLFQMRKLIADYEALLDELMTKLTPANHPLAVALAAIPEKIRGYGHVKARHLAAAKADEAALLEQFRSGVPPLLKAAE